MFEKIKNKIKRIFSIKLNYYIKHFFELKKTVIPKFKLKEDENRVFFLDAPAYGNIGDQAIAFAMEKFILDKFPSYTQYEILEKDFAKYFSWLKQNIKKDDVICLTGGGNMGDMYQKYEAIRRLVISTFSANTIIIFPQTISYSSDKYGIKELNKAKKIYNSASRLTIMAREEKSYDFMKKNFNKCKIILSPDIVLYLDYYEKYKKNKEIGVCLRDDQEKSISKDLKKQINCKFPESDTISTTIECDNTINISNRKDVLEKTLKMFGTHKMVITDRLHAMIFSYITNTPCIALPNSNGKVKNVYNTWLKQKGKIYFVEDDRIDDVKIQTVNKIYKNKIINFDRVKVELDICFNNTREDNE